MLQTLYDTVSSCRSFSLIDSAMREAKLQCATVGVNSMKINQVPYPSSQTRILSSDTIPSCSKV